MSDVQIIRHLPGTALKNGRGEVDFRNGRVEFVSQYSILVRMRHPEHPWIRLIGETYIYWCPKCQMNVWEVERIRSRGACPKCSGGLWALSEGDYVRLHYRVSKDRQSAAWWAEKFIP